MGPLEYQCPQTDHNEDILEILAGLETWRTDFWKSSKFPKVTDTERENLLELGLNGLVRAAKLLHIQTDFQDQSRREPLDFSAGAKGLSGERLLLRHFCAHGIEMALLRLEKKWANSNTHWTELEFPARFARLASTLIGDGRWTPDAIENLLQVVALFGHQVLDIPVRVDLVRHLRQTLRGETALHTLKARYRDHFFHTLEVCFLGFALLKSQPSEGQTLAEAIVNKIPPDSLSSGGGKNIEPQTLEQRIHELLSQWWMAALVHDTAYGIDIFGGTLELMDYFSISKEVKDFTETARKAVAQMADPQRLKELAPELEKDPTVKKGDHGVIAALSLNQTLLRIGTKTRDRFP